MIVVAEGPTAAGKTTWCLRHFPHATISETPTSQEVEEALSLRQRYEVWIEGNCRRWERAMTIEQSQGVAVCDTDPFKLYYSWCLWRIGKVTSDEWEQGATASRVAFAGGRLGIADLILVQLPPHGELVRRRERDRAEREQTKALLRLLVKDLRVNGRSEILPTYHVVTDAVCSLPSSVGGTRHCANQVVAAEPLIIE